MSILKHITVNKCPICGCTDVVKESVQYDCIWEKPEIFVHTNGKRNERREFLCGCIVKYVSNYNTNCITSSNCFYSPENIAKKKKLADDKELVSKFLIEQNISTEIATKIMTYCL